MTQGGDQELAAKASRGDAAAFACLLERHYDRIHRLAWRLTGNRTDAEDVAQEVCVKLAGALRGYREEAEVGTWIWRITYNAATDLLRSRQRMQPHDPSDMEVLMDVAAAAAPEDSSDVEQLWEEVRRLPRQQRDAVLLVYAEEMSHAEAAKVMGCSEKTVSWHLHEARKRLKSKLQAVG